MAHPLYVSPFIVVAAGRGGGICEMLISRSRFDLGVAGGVIRRNAGIIQLAQGVHAASLLPPTKLCCGNYFLT